MAKNCLVTKLKGVVDNDNLEVLGRIVLTYVKDVTNVQSLFDGDCLLGHYGNVTYSKNGAAISEAQAATYCANSVDFNISADEGACIYLDKYKCTRIITSGAKVSKLSGSTVTEIRFLDADAIVDRLACLNGANIKRLTIGYSGTTGTDILSYTDIMKNCKSLENLNVGYTPISVLSGSIEDIATLPNLYRVDDKIGRNVIWDADLRPSTMPIISSSKDAQGYGLVLLKAGDFIANMAKCQASADDTLKQVCVFSLNLPTDTIEQSDVAAIKAKGYKVIINNVEQ